MQNRLSWHFPSYKRDDFVRSGSSDSCVVVWGVHMRLTSSLVLVALAAVLVTVEGTAARDAGQAPQAQAPDGVDVLILLRSAVGPDDEAMVRGLGGRIKYTYRIVSAVAANLPQAALTALQSHPRVALVEADAEVSAIEFDQDPDYAAELAATWGVAHIGSGVAHASFIRGAAVNVAVIDTGILYNHPGLAGRYQGGWDFVNNDADPLDDNGHGTRVSGVIASIRDGVGSVGVAPEAHLYALKVLGANGSGQTSNIIAAVDWAASHNIQVTNNRYGASGPSATANLAFANAAAAGLVHVAAAMNNGNCEGTGTNYGYPAGYRSVIAVAATDAADLRACFSSTGDAVQIAAPGVQIYTTNKTGGFGSNNSGTSVASPHMAGTAALLVGRGMYDANSNGRINDEVRNLLVTTARDLGPIGRDPLYGFGLVDVPAALAAADTAPPLTLRVDAITYATASGKGNAKDLKVTIGTVYGLVAPQAGAQVSITLMQNGAYYGSATGTTDINGLVTLTFKNLPAGAYTTMVTNAAAGGLTWDQVTPPNSFVK